MPLFRYLPEISAFFRTAVKFSGICRPANPPCFPGIRFEPNFGFPDSALQSWVFMNVKTLTRFEPPNHDVPGCSTTVRGKVWLDNCMSNLTSYELVRLKVGLNSNWEMVELYKV